MALVVARNSELTAVAVLQTSDSLSDVEAVLDTREFAERTREDAGEAGVDDPKQIRTFNRMSQFLDATHYTVIRGVDFQSGETVKMPLARKYGVDLDFALTIEATSQEKAEDLAGEAVAAVEKALGEAIHYNIEVREV